MKRIRKVWEENRVLLVLGIILIICIVVVAIVSLTYFYGSSDSVYGKRLEVTKETPLNKKLFRDIESELEKDELVKEVLITQKGKIVYITINYLEKTEMAKAKEIASSAINLFNDDELAVYDIEFTISSPKKDEFIGYTLMGARNANGIGDIVWNNYNIETEDEEVE